MGHETLSFTTKAHALLPADEYGLIEFYCSDPGCDCRRVMFSVCRLSDDTIVATLSYGWEPPDYYARWSPHDPLAHTFSGVSIDPLRFQSSLSEPLRVVVALLIADDSAYRARLRRHYDLFRESSQQTVRGPSGKPNRA